MSNLYRTILTKIRQQADSVRIRAESIACELQHKDAINQLQTHADTELLSSVEAFLKNRG